MGGARLGSEELVKLWSDLPGPAKFAFAATAVWLLGTAWVIYQKPLAALEANALGDFVAGATAPLAFLWLAMAVILQTKELGLQREELKQSREALEVQAAETRALVKESARSAEIANLTLKQQQHANAEERLHKLLDAIGLKIVRLADRTTVTVGRSGNYTYVFDTTHTLNEARQGGIDDVYALASRALQQFLDRLSSSPQELVPRNQPKRSTQGELSRLAANVKSVIAIAREDKHETVLMRIDAIELELFASNLEKLITFYG